MVGQGLQWVAFDLPSSQSRDAAVGRPGVVLVADAMAGRPGGRLAGAEQPVRSRLLGRRRVAAVGQPADRARGRWRTLPTWADLAFGLDLILSFGLLSACRCCRSCGRSSRWLLACRSWAPPASS